MESRPLIYESHFAPLAQGDRLHLRRIFRPRPSPAILMIHGSIENGRIFYSEQGKGLAPYLAEQGFDVFVADLRGRGLGEPRIGRHSRYGQTEEILEDIPAFLKLIREVNGEAPRHWIAHSWGGVLMASHLARFPENLQGIASMVFFGSKRCIRIRSWEKFLKIDLFWNQVAHWMIAAYGYLPTQRWKIGSDNETRLSHKDCMTWVEPGPWIDPHDGFDYAQAARSIAYPPTLQITGAADSYLGHPSDVKDFIAEMGESHCEFHVLGRAQGNLHDYGHIDILTHPDARRDHFPKVAQWLKNGESPRWNSHS